MSMVSGQSRHRRPSTKAKAAKELDAGQPCRRPAGGADQPTNNEANRRTASPNLQILVREEVTE